MESFNTDGIVLKVRHTGESDRIVTVLTRNYGVINAFAKSARRPKSKLHTGTQTFCYADFSFQRTGDAYKITEASVKEVFFDLNQDICLLTLAQYFGQIATELVGNDDNNSENLRLILNSIHFLCQRKRDPALIKAITELRLCVNAGYAPELTVCGKCGEEATGEMIFHFSSGSVYCMNCGGYVADGKLTPNVLEALQRVVYSDFERIYSFTLTDEDIRIFSRICERYLIVQTERTYSALDFYKNIPK